MTMSNQYYYEINCESGSEKAEFDEVYIIAPNLAEAKERIKKRHGVEASYIERVIE